MSPRISRLYQLALCDNEFLEAQDKFEDDKKWIKEVRKDEMGKHLFAMCYWGWVLGKGTADIIEAKLPPKH